MFIIFVSISVDIEKLFESSPLISKEIVLGSSLSKLKPESNSNTFSFTYNH